MLSWYPETTIHMPFDSSWKVTSITTLLFLRISQPMVWVWAGTISLFGQWQTGGVVLENLFETQPFFQFRSVALVVLKLHTVPAWFSTMDSSFQFTVAAPIVNICFIIWFYKTEILSSYTDTEIAYYCTKLLITHNKYWKGIWALIWLPHTTSIQFIEWINTPPFHAFVVKVHNRHALMYLCDV